MITLRPYHSKYSKSMMRLFYDTVHTVNRNDYSPEQLRTWAKTPDMCWEKWNSRFSNDYCILAFDEKVLTGFGSLNGDYLDMLYVHHAYQRQGIGSTIIVNLMDYARRRGITKMTTHASLTAEPFMKDFGFKHICENEVRKEGVSLTNILMQKTIDRLHNQKENAESKEKNYA